MDSRAKAHPQLQEGLFHRQLLPPLQQRLPRVPVQQRPCMDSVAESDGLVRQIVLLELANLGHYITASVCPDFCVRFLTVCRKVWKVAIS